MEQKTPLYDRHIECGGKLTPFAGYLLPIQYSGIIEEHMAVRKAAGLFDVSHMGEFKLSGKDAPALLEKLLTNSFTGLREGRVRYSPMCMEDGGVIDDLLVYHLAQDSYMIVVNACNRLRDAEWIRSHLSGDALFEDVSDSVALLALQGPRSKEILSKLAFADDLPTAYYSFADGVSVSGARCLVSRTGYTGEYGYELYCENGDAPRLWDELLTAGVPCGLIPCGLGARDTLRMEAAMPLYGHELSADITPLEAGLDFCVKLDKPDFVGKDALIKRGEPKVTRVGLKITGRGVAREGCPVLLDGVPVGRVTSGTHLPYLGGPHAMALIDRAYASIGQNLDVDVRGRKVSAVVTPLPFYKLSTDK